jgi:3-oxosteroid 1-dehydrogenase
VADEIELETTATVDVVVVGSGGAGLVAAITAADQGASVLVAERSDKYGGTTAFSGGKIWIPNNHHMRRLGIADTEAAARTYLRRLLGDDELAMINTFLRRGPEMAEYVETKTPLKFYPCTHYPDYHPEFDGATSGGRALDAMPFDATGLGEDLDRLRRSPIFLPFTHEEWERWRTVANFDWELLGERISKNIVTVGAAIVAALLQGCVDRGIELRHSTRVVRLLRSDQRVYGVAVERADGPAAILARQGVILACGGFEWNDELQRRFLRTTIRGAASPPWNEGDGVVMGAEIGAQLGNMSEAWWMPVLQVPGESVDDRPLYRALISERGLPGSIIVNRKGRRFVDEAHNYNDISRGFQTFDPVAFEHPNVPAWLIFDERFHRNYSLATVMPGEPVPSWVARADSPTELATQLGIDPDGLTETLARFGDFARSGRDLDFARGESLYDRYYGDASVQPNPNLAPIEEPPFYAVEVLPGTIGTKGGLVTDPDARVLDVRGKVIPGLYATGNVASFWLGRGYPGPGASIGPGMTFGYLAALDATRGSAATAIGLAAQVAE